MCDLPLEIDNEEHLVRAVLTPFHFKTKKGVDVLQPRVFRSTAGVDEVSVIRVTHKGPDFCKQKGKELTAVPLRNYCGFLVIKAADIRELQCDITDSREEYCGHAHICHGIIIPENEPGQLPKKFGNGRTVQKVDR